MLDNVVLRRNLWMTMAYDGTCFNGWQRQVGVPTIQAVVEDCLEQITGSKVTLEGSGRTDAGVHALGQVANFHTDNQISTSELLRALNALLPPSVRLLNLASAPSSFHARKTARKKRYAYRFFLASQPPLFGRDYALQVRYPLDLQAMRRAGSLMVGTRDFAAFATNPGVEQGSTVRDLGLLHLVQKGPNLWLVVQGNGFLYNMVRTIAGTLLEVGRGRFSPDYVSEILASGDRCQAGPVLPARGLMLVRVIYDNDDLICDRSSGRWGTAHLRSLSAEQN